MDKNAIIEKIELRNDYLIKKREAQKSRKSDDFVMSIEHDIQKINIKINELTFSDNI